MAAVAAAASVASSCISPRRLLVVIKEPFKEKWVWLGGLLGTQLITNNDAGWRGSPYPTCVVELRPIPPTDVDGYDILASRHGCIGGPWTAFLNDHCRRPIVGRPTVGAPCEILHLYSGTNGVFCHDTFLKEPRGRSALNGEMAEPDTVPLFKCRPVVVPC